MTFRIGVKFSKWSDFIENGLKLIGLLCGLNKGLTYVQCPDIGQWRGQRSTPTDAI